MVNLPSQGTATAKLCSIVTRCVDLPVNISPKVINNFEKSCCEDLFKRVRNAGHNSNSSITEAPVSPTCTR